MISTTLPDEKTNYTLAGAYLSLRRAVIEALNLLGLPSCNVDSYLNNTALRNDLIRAEYVKRMDCGEKSEAVIVELSEKYSLSRKSIDNIVHRK